MRLLTRWNPCLTGWDEFGWIRLIMALPAGLNLTQNGPRSPTSTSSVTSTTRFLSPYPTSQSLQHGKLEVLRKLTDVLCGLLTSMFRSQPIPTLRAHCRSTKRIHIYQPQTQRAEAPWANGLVWEPSRPAVHLSLGLWFKSATGNGSLFYQLQTAKRVFSCFLSGKKMHFQAAAGLGSFNSRLGQNPHAVNAATAATQSQNQIRSVCEMNSFRYVE